MSKSPPISIPGVRDAVKQITPYVPGKFIEDVQSEFGLESVIKIASNENPFGPFPNSILRMREEVANLNLYPDTSFKALRHTLAKVHGIDPDCICISHGAEGMLQTLGKCFIQDGDEAIVPEVTYTLYSEITKVMGAKVVRAAMKNFRPDLTAVRKALSDRTKIIWLANPNNPTSAIVDKHDLKALTDDLPPTAWLVLDEAYAEYTDPDLLPDRVEWIGSGRRVVSVRTFSKAYGLAGARLGYAMARKDLVSYLNTVSEPFNANRVAIAGGLAALTEDADHVARAMASVKDLRARCTARLREMGLHVVDSHANFILFQSPLKADDLFSALMAQGVIVRPCTPWGYVDRIRLTIGLPQEMEAFFNALIRVLKQGKSLEAAHG